jgi:hypothetical protein
MGGRRGARERTSAMAAALALLVAACGGGGAKPDAGATGGGGAGGDGGGGGADGGAGARGVDAGGGADAPRDLATDFGADEDAGPVTCPTGAATGNETGAVIDDFRDGGRLNGRLRQAGAFTVAEQFDATANAKLDFAPRVEAACGALTPGAAHIRGTAADTGATFALVFAGKGGDGGKAPAFFDASATSGVVFYVALGDAQASKVFSLQVNLADSQWDYVADVIVDGTAWQKVEVRWADLQAAAAAPKFSAATLNQLVFPLAADERVDLFIDDLAFLP